MVQRLSRKEFYELVWSEPMKNLSVRFGISGVALKKTCARAAVPTPDRGYWARKEVGKSTFQPSLPERPPGIDDEVVVAGGGTYWYQEWTKEDILAPLPPTPEFQESIEAVRKRISKVIGSCRSHETFATGIPQFIVLKEDEKRRQKQLATGYSWDAPLFESSFERRRLRLLNTLFVAAARMGGKPIASRDAQSIHLTFYQQHVGLRLARTKEHIRRGYAATNARDPSDTKFSFSILEGSAREKKESVGRTMITENLKPVLRRLRPRSC